jgi:hypoxanthine phosphoribosyltransferase
MPVLEQVVEEMKTLNEAELQDVATYLAFLKFRAKTNPTQEAQWAALYTEFAEEDRKLAEEGMEDYTRGLLQEDAQ